MVEVSCWAKRYIDSWKQFAIVGTQNDLKYLTTFSNQCFNANITQKTFSLTSSRFKFLFNWASVCIFINCSALLPLCTFLYSWSKLLSLSELREAHFFNFLLLNAFFAKDILQLSQTVNSKAICEQKLLNQQFQDKYGSIDYQAIFVNKKQSDNGSTRLER